VYKYLKIALTTCNSTALKLRIDVEVVTPAEQNTQDRTPVLAEESEGSQVGGHQETAAIPELPGHTQSSSTGAESPQAPNIIPPEIQTVLAKIASNYLLTTPPMCQADHDNFLIYMEKMRLVITGVGIGSLLITVRCDSLEILERLWEDYSSGHLGEVVQRCFVTEEILTELSLAELKLQTTILEEEYIACKMYFEKHPARGNSFEKEFCLSKIVKLIRRWLGLTSKVKELRKTIFKFYMYLYLVSWFKIPHDLTKWKPSLHRCTCVHW